MVYVVQAEECELSYDLMQKLAAILKESPGVTHADATYRLRNSYGILVFDEQVEGNRVCQRFTESGVPAFLLDTLLPPAITRPLNREKPEVDGEIQLAVTGRLNLTTRTKTTEFNPLGIQVAYPRIPIPGSGITEHTTEKTEIRFYIDLFTPTTHWRAHAGNLLVLQPVVELIRSTSALLSVGIRNLLKNDKRLPIFQSEDEFDKYVKWLYQIRYSNPNGVW
jgi:hypothetical protein